MVWCKDLLALKAQALQTYCITILDCHFLIQYYVNGLQYYYKYIHISYLLYHTNVLDWLKDKCLDYFCNEFLFKLTEYPIKREGVAQCHFKTHPPVPLHLIVSVTLWQEIQSFLALILYYIFFFFTLLSLYRQRTCRCHLFAKVGKI